MAIELSEVTILRRIAYCLRVGRREGSAADTIRLDPESVRRYLETNGWTRTAMGTWRKPGIEENCPTEWSVGCRNETPFAPADESASWQFVETIAFADGRIAHEVLAHMLEPDGPWDSVFAMTSTRDAKGQ